ncbi:hypothetical protein PCASD_15379 [Puccinia coronata f. sp. avenae]|uniref:hydroxymethylglutaryl-CoA lyase n=1 Tax=Puccinia coronata f. sp. avenae TaxID=200324 RepID=A0A2N5SZR3_9BASI|nr:hypothetical protein PCASD_15379 [Puccinia coronata f. sp. avenae]
MSKPSLNSPEAQTVSLCLQQRRSKRLSDILIPSERDTSREAQYLNTYCQNRRVRFDMGDLPLMRSLHRFMLKEREPRLFRGMSMETRETGFRSPRPVRVMEVSPRDGLQNESKILPTELKVQLIEKLIGLKLTHIEVGSFVSPKWVPQMASTTEVITHLALRKARNSNAATFSCLIPNLRGFEAFTETNSSSGANQLPVVDEIALFASATEGFSKANINSSISESIKKMSEVAGRAQGQGLKIRGYVSCAFGCPYEGKVDPKNVASVTQELLDIGCYEVAISDTIGVGVPSQVEECLNQLARSGINLEQLGVHCHDTFGTGLSNILTAVKMGVRTVDSSVGGIGGCPYSPGSTGNIATEDVVYALESSGYHTGLLPSPLESTAQLGNDAHLLRQLEPLARVGATPSHVNDTANKRTGAQALVTFHLVSCSVRKGASAELVGQKHPDPPSGMFMSELLMYVQPYQERLRMSLKIQSFKHRGSLSATLMSIQLRVRTCRFRQNLRPVLVCTSIDRLPWLGPPGAEAWHQQSLVADLRSEI